MKLRFYFRWLLVFSAGLCASSAEAQNLPDAPQTATPPTHVAVPATRSSTAEALKRRQWSDVVEPGEKIPPLTFHQKLLFPLHEELQPVYTLVPVLAVAGYGVWRNTDPKLGTDSGGFGERVGEGALRQAISRELSDGLLPIAFHQDPRYFRKAYGSYDARIEHAIARIFITQNDSGAKSVNYSDILGRGMSAALTQTYYPQKSIGSGVVLHTWGVSLLALGGGNLFVEFWPDVKKKVFGKSQ